VKGPRPQSFLAIIETGCMTELPSNEFVELRNGLYYLRGSRIGLGCIIWPLRYGELTVDELAEGFAISPDRMQGIMNFISEHPEAIEQYLENQKRRWEDLTTRYPMDPDLARIWQEASEAREQFPKSA
jgi:hypothetical protein